jgi:hypothetical protein
MTATMAAASTGVQPLRRRGLSRWLLVGVVLAGVGALMAAFVYVQAAGRVSIVAMARPVPFGQVVGRDDVRELALPADTGLATVPWSDVDSVVGRTAATDLLAGQAVAPGSVAGDRPPRKGEAVVGVSLGPGRIPLTPLAVRDEVLVVGVGDATAPMRATVLRAGDPDLSGRRIVDLLVDERVADELARASADNRAALVLVGRR